MDLLAGYDSDASASGGSGDEAPHAPLAAVNAATPAVRLPAVSAAPEPSTNGASGPGINAAPSPAGLSRKRPAPEPEPDVAPGPAIPAKFRKEMELKSKGIDDIPAPEDAEQWARLPAPKASTTGAADTSGGTKKKVVKLQLPALRKQMMERAAKLGAAAGSDSDEEDRFKRRAAAGNGAGGGPLAWLPPPKSDGSAGSGFGAGPGAGARLDVGAGRPSGATAAVTRVQPLARGGRRGAGSDSDDDFDAGLPAGDDDEMPDLRNIAAEGGIADADFDPSTAPADVMALPGGAAEGGAPGPSPAVHPSAAYAVQAGPQTAAGAQAYDYSAYGAYHYGGQQYDYSAAAAGGAASAAAQGQAQAGYGYGAAPSAAADPLAAALAEEAARASRRGAGAAAGLGGIQFTEVNQKVRLHWRRGTCSRRAARWNCCIWAACAFSRRLCSISSSVAFG